jgi:hemerythrin-like metal-binding protein
MPHNRWSDALALGLDAMDDTHEEFFTLLAATAQAPEASLLERWEALIAHTHGHFAQENRWMADTGFSSTNCHIAQHHVILQIMEEGLRRGREGELTLVRQLALELGSWFPQHVQGMDAALALHLRGVGYDPATGVVALPEALPTEEIHGCGGACSTPAEPRTAAREAAATSCASASAEASAEREPAAAAAEREPAAAAA